MVLRFFANFRVGNFQLFLSSIANSYLNRCSNIHVSFHRVFNIIYGIYVFFDNLHCIYHVAILSCDDHNPILTISRNQLLSFMDSYRTHPMS